MRVAIVSVTVTMRSGVTMPVTKMSDVIAETVCTTVSARIRTEVSDYHAEEHVAKAECTADGV